MRGSNYRTKLPAAFKAAHGERGTAMVEYVGMMAGIAIMVIASLAFLGGAVGGGWTNVVINAPLSDADYGINPHACKQGGWEGMDRSVEDGGGGFINQGDCMQYANTGM